jgi:hypothetical protein
MSKPCIIIFPHPISSPSRDYVAMRKSPECHSEPQAKNLALPATYEGEIGYRLRTTLRHSLRRRAEGEGAKVY